MIALTVVPTSSEDKFLEVEETMKYNNLAKARSFGADFTFNYQVLPSLAIGGGYSYTDAKAQYTEDQNDPNYMKYLPMSASAFSADTSPHAITSRMEMEKPISSGV